MKIYISADIEGTAGITNWDEARKIHADYPEHRQQMTREVLAACAGANAAGAKDILIKDAHATGRNIIQADLPENARLVRGWSGHPMSMVQELDKSFDAAMFIGYHSKAGDETNPLAHTLNLEIMRMRINGVPTSEFLMHAYAAAYVGVPVVFVSGDKQLCADIKGHNPNITTVALSEGKVLEYDDVMNKQREVIYQHRRAVLGGTNLKDDLRGMMDGLVDSALNIYCPAEQYPEEWDIKGLAEIMYGQFGLDITQGKSDGGEALRAIGRDALLEDLRAQVRDTYDRREQDLSPDLMRFLEKNFMLQVIDHHWKDHLLGMDHLRDGIGLRGYGQKDPLIEYKREGYDLFAGMMERVKSDSLDRLFHVQAVRNEGQPTAPSPPPIISRPQPPLILNRGEEPAAPQTVQRSDNKVGRNDPCPCGSGKKYKKCHGA